VPKRGRSHAVRGSGAAPESTIHPPGAPELLLFC
jgi:hypothetical protein